MSSGEPVRLFIGTRVPVDACSMIRAAAAGTLGDRAWRVATEAQWHVTALFIGDRPSEQIPYIRQRTEQITAATQPITLVQGQLVTMPKVAPTMLWVRFTPNPALTALHHALAQAIGAEPSGYSPYWPHITLARSRGLVPTITEGPKMLDRLVVEELTLFRSDATPRGREHVPLCSWPLV